MYIVVENGDYGCGDEPYTVVIGAFSTLEKATVAANNAVSEMTESIEILNGEIDSAHLVMVDRIMA